MHDPVTYVIGPGGGVLTPANLPSNPLRWTRLRKAEVAVAVRDGLLSLDDACARYGLSSEELIGWQGALSRMGVRGLMVKYTRTNVHSVDGQ